jgi:hypothetical protein
VTRKQPSIPMIWMKTVKASRRNSTRFEIPFGPFQRIPSCLKLQAILFGLARRAARRIQQASLFYLLSDVNVKGTRCSLGSVSTKKHAAIRNISQLIDIVMANGTT